jgi:hypothetical protein
MIEEFFTFEQLAYNLRFTFNFYPQISPRSDLVITSALECT